MSTHSKTISLYFRYLQRALDKLKKQIKAAKEEKKRLRELAALGIDPSTVPKKEKDGKEKP